MCIQVCNGGDAGDCYVLCIASAAKDTHVQSLYNNVYLILWQTSMQCHSRSVLVLYCTTMQCWGLHLSQYQFSINIHSCCVLVAGWDKNTAVHHILASNQSARSSRRRTHLQETKREKDKVSNLFIAMQQ